MMTVMRWDVILWFGGFLMLLLGGVGGYRVLVGSSRRRKGEPPEERRRRRTLEEIAFSKGHAASSSVEGKPRRWSFHFAAKLALDLMYRLTSLFERTHEARAKVLLLHTFDSAVIRNDERLLSDMFDTRVFTLRVYPQSAYLRNLVHLFFWMLWHIWGARGVFFRFVDYYAAIPAFFTWIFRKKLWIVLGGYDAHHFPRYHYGVYDTPVRAWCARFAVRRATHLLPVDESLWDGVNTYISWVHADPPAKTGVKSLVPGIRADVRVIHNGFDSVFWQPDPKVQRDLSVLTIAGIPKALSESAKERTALLKGVLLILDVAAKMPQYRFLIAGTDRASLPEGLACPANVEFTGYLVPGELRRLYQKTKVFAMPSMTEGMPSALADAMLCECVPVGSSVNGIPRLIGETGFVVERPEASQWVAAIEKAMHVSMGPAARERIVAEFSIEKRRRQLQEVLCA